MQAVLAVAGLWWLLAAGHAAREIIDPPTEDKAARNRLRHAWGWVVGAHVAGLILFGAYLVQIGSVPEDTSGEDAMYLLTVMVSLAELLQASSLVPGISLVYGLENARRHAPGLTLVALSFLLLGLIPWGYVFAALHRF